MACLQNLEQSNKLWFQFLSMSAATIQMVQQQTR
eukprot:CAMPEP_0194756596 /NCGR_PEP_ID=MMETSP0323_2-20130528/10268_1 /TAXON_ID=2866 ORGANISM="Crypthecodinium cohnii, Strain Seligo" /NCGR_SAMPLE_ID=MMETSP0323_2 /ASSEMBLY_ACC=CAM_ASM_000346 /LENGTH=33 /DNA_ID= /DNA_START= /DNA_END= /DNA_ORIENTATION=